MTKQQAINLAGSHWWVGCSPRAIAMFQLHESRLCMPFSVFQEAVEKALGRSVFTHEFGSAGIKRLRRELLGNAPAPTMDEIMAIVPEDKRILVLT